MTSVEVKSAEVSIRRPPAVKTLIGVLWFLGLTALGGGIEMLVFPNGNEYLPAEFLDHIPLVDSFVVPGLVLAIVFGIGSLFVVWGVQRLPGVTILEDLETRTGRHWSWAGLVALGIAFTTWMVVEIALLGPPWDSDPGDAAAAWVLYGIYGTVAVALLVVPQLTSVKEHLSCQAKNQDASL